MDKLAVMNAFCRIVDRGSFSRAAEDVGVSAALLSREVRLLEESLGTMLLVRTTRSMSLTESGQAYYDQARAILDAVGRIEDRIRESAGALRGQLRVNAPGTFGQVVVAPMLPAFLDAFPDLALTLSLDDRVVDMVQGGFDLSIRVMATMPDSTLVARRLGSVRQQLFAAPAYLRRFGVPGTPADLPAHRIAGFLHADHLTDWSLESPDGSTRIAVDPQVRVGSSLVLRDLLVAGQGIGTLPDFVAREPVARGDLVCVLPGHELPRRTVCAVTPGRSGSDPRADAFLDHLRAALAGADC
ncbi:MAG: LysR family transcriptional regulator [Pseudomonadota bacterium]|nr:LysR family transcriptional regulator [Pseudomonadota bacterium]